MDSPVRILLLDLLVEREEFGHGGNIEILTPIADRFGELEVILLTPQYQSAACFEVAATSDLIVDLEESMLEEWDDAFAFVADRSIVLKGGIARLRRVSLPDFDSKDDHMVTWLKTIGAEALICSGSRRNVSEWEPWMEPAASLMRSAVEVGLPTLGICFGHQLLCKALGGEVTRAASRTDAVIELRLTDAGASDPLFSGMASPVCLYTHQDHVSDIPSNVIPLGNSAHTEFPAVRVVSESGVLLPVWGAQFHPEAAKSRIERSHRLGHIGKEELEAFQREHDGARVLVNFAAQLERR